MVKRTFNKPGVILITKRKYQSIAFLSILYYKQADIIITK